MKPLGVSFCQCHRFLSLGAVSIILNLQKNKIKINAATVLLGQEPLVIFKKTSDDETVVSRLYIFSM